MTTPEVQFVLDAINDHYGTALSNVPLERIDRDNADILEQSVHSISGELERTNFVGATLASRDPQAIGTEYDHDIQAVVGVRIEGAHHSEHGHIDPDGSNGVEWWRLKKNIRRAILTDREFPAVSNRPNTTYTDLQFANENDQSDDYADYYRYDFDVLFNGFETLP